MNFIKSELLLVLVLFCVLNGCATKEEEEQFNTIPSLSIQEMDFLRGISVIKINPSGSWRNNLRIKAIELFNGAESLGKQSKNISGSYSIPFDSKILGGINQLTAVAILEGVSSFKENSITIDFDVEVDNYIPNIFIENDYIESKNRSNKFSLGNESSGNYLETFISNYNINFVLLNEYGDVISEVSPSKSFVGTPKGLLIPEKSTGRNFFFKYFNALFN
ncbi:hypothetical protein EI427_25455 [Flammeovirga pectinis]|uniref:Uncharacterized protein n=1 Tax=Flammeovirga pectinis TaxID=2494373 RepID=A0A3S9PBR7_9BACT|nr:hypothetical protein [Flammeovirga pectinis]AZQ65563.1 hypothetical protein EI427_25455 [Flammeovirga pectinis]